MTIKSSVFVDAQEMHKKHPATFEVPSFEALSQIKMNDSVKVCADKERFWVTVITVDDHSIEGIVDNDLICTDEHGLRCGDKVVLSRNNVYSILKG